MILMTSRWLGILRCLPVAAVLACGHAPGPTLDDRVFVSQTVTENGAPYELVEGTQLQLRFFESRRFGAAAGCNTLGGTHAIEAGRFVVSDAAQTEIGCEAELLHQDDWYFGFLVSRPAITVEGDTLVLEGGGKRIEYLDQEVATPDVSLAGRTWTVDTIIRDGAAMSAAWPRPATLVLQPNGVVTIDTGCNTGSGTYRVSGTRIWFADVSVTERACSGDTEQLERAVLDLLYGPQPVMWEITVDRLSLRAGDDGLDLAAGVQ